MPTACPICARRRGKRFCPGLAAGPATGGAGRWAGRGKSETICAPCCGEQREVTIDCPSHCTYLQAAHRYEAERPKRPTEMPFPKVEIEEEFVEEKQPLLASLGLAILRLARERSDLRDLDVLAALEALAQSYQTLESGIYYEQTPSAPAAQALAAALKQFLAEYSQEQQQRLGASLRPGDVLRALVFLRRLGQLETNGRPLSRRYLAFFERQLPAAAATPPPPRIILPGQ